MDRFQTWCTSSPDDRKLHQKIVVITRIPCKVVKLQISRVRVGLGVQEPKNESLSHLKYKQPRSLEVAQKNCGHYTASLQGCEASNT